MTPMRSPHAVARIATAASLMTALATMTLSTPASADTHGDAVKAFEEGRKLRESDAEKAATAFERSIKLEPSIGAYYNLGQVNEQLGRVREAVDAFRKAEKLAVQKGDARNKDAQDAWGKLLDTHNYVVLNVGDDIKATPGLTLIVDGIPVPQADYNGEVFRSATTHEVVVTATGRKDLRLPGLPNKQPVNVTLGAVASEPSTPPPPTPPPAEPSSSGGGWGTQKWAGLGLMAVGVGALTYGVIDLVSYEGKRSDALDAAQPYANSCKGTADAYTSCPGTALVPADGNRARAAYHQTTDDGASSIPLWITLAVLGTAASVTGVVLFVNAPSHASEPAPASARARARLDVRIVPRVGLHDSGLGVVGTF